MAALTPLIGALLTLASCYFLGSLLLARLGIVLLRTEKVPLAFTLGAAALHFIVFVVLTFHLATTVVLIAIPVLIVAAGLWTGDGRMPAGSDEKTPQSGIMRGVRCILLAAAMLYTILYFFNAWAPEFSPDGTGYHLPVIARYLGAHGFAPLPTNVYSTLSEGVELVFLPAFAIGGASAAALVHFGFLLALGLMIRAFGLRIGHGLAGEAAAVLVYLSPVVGVVGTSAYVDAAVAAIVFSVFYWTELWDTDRRLPMLICVGAMGGYCYAAKYTAATIAVYAVVFVVWRTRQWKPAAVVIACAALTAVPWMLKDWVYVQNPIAPFGNRIFRNPYIHVEFERLWTEFLRSYGGHSRWEIARDVFLDGQVTGTPLGPLFLLLPLGLLALRNGIGRRLLMAGTLAAVGYFANVGSRFLIPSLPFFTLAMTMAVEYIPMALVAMALFHAWISWPPEVRRHTKAMWAIQHIPVKAALRRQSPDDYLRKFRDYRWARLIARSVPPGEKVLALETTATFYAERDTLICYEGTLNEQLCDAEGVAWDKFSAPSRALVFHFPERALKGIRVVQTVKAPKPDELWSIHELRIYRGGQEVPRAADWRLNAFPNPWDAHYAFDNSRATRWRSWETAAPGMFISAGFGSEIHADQVQVETSYDDADLKLRLEAMGADGTWKLISDAPEERPISGDESLRRAATDELRAHGVNYIFVLDSNKDRGGPLLAEDPDSWNLKPIAHAEGATIYRVGR